MLYADDPVLFQAIKELEDFKSTALRNLVSSRATLGKAVRFEKSLRFPTDDRLLIQLKIGGWEDTLLGVFQPATIERRFLPLTDYYLGNELLGFSPEGSYFAFRHGCWEGICSFGVRQANDLSPVKLSFEAFSGCDGPECADAKFLRWISDTEVEYSEGTSHGESGQIKRVDLRNGTVTSTVPAKKEPQTAP